MNANLGISPNEQIIIQVRRHPIALLPVFISTGLVVVAVLVGYLYLAKYNAMIAQYFPPSALGIALELILLVVSVVLLLAIYVYSQSSLILTNENLVQVKQIGLFSRKVAVLNLRHIEDVTGSVNGVLATTFGYGEITVETAGEQENFIFSPVANPYPIVELINRTHQTFEQSLAGRTAE